MTQDRKASNDDASSQAENPSWLQGGGVQGAIGGGGAGTAVGAGLGTLTGTLVGGTASVATGGLGAAVGGGVGALHGPFVKLGASGERPSEAAAKPPSVACLPAQDGQPKKKPKKLEVRSGKGE
ncbi:hypothetical protein LTR85_008346 [Meristemomyces frigidus]|nr:hypothetical protein LTR85_008346 [Meristemomyces frigidus]